MATYIGRRKFLAALGGAAAAWPLMARAQQSERMRRVGVLMPGDADNPDNQARLAAFLQGLQQFGWAVGRNLRIDLRWAAGQVDRNRQYAEELVGLAPDVILAAASGVSALKQATRTVPIVFTIVADPVGLGFVDNMARPGGNITGFSAFEYGTSGKWLELLKQVSTGVTRAAVVRDPAILSGAGQFAAVASVGPALGVDIVPVNVSDPGELENKLAAFARSPNGGVVVTGSAFAVMRRDLIIKLAAQHRLPAVYYERAFVVAGGLISYGPDFVDLYRRAASYVDRILKGEKPADLPVQAPTKYDLVINLKTAKALGLEIPPTLLARADEVIE
jgi:putative tryptophan/tyrosine transport system substrate-binding protein